MAVRKGFKVTRDTVPRTEEEMKLCLQSPWYRLNNLYTVLSEAPDGVEGDGMVMKFRMNDAQVELFNNLHWRNIILKARQLGFCLEPSTRVLTADLRWVPIADLKPGQEVVACDEHTPGGRGQSRKMRTATVQAAAEVHRKAYRVTFDDGRQVVCTGQHPWLTRKAASDAKWRSIEGKGNNVVGRIKPGTKVRWVAQPWSGQDYEDGWMAGMLDGEGSMALPSSTGAEINVSQVAGPCFARMEWYLHSRGYHYRTETDTGQRDSKHGSTAVDKLCVSRMDEMFRLVGQTRPSRFIGRRFWEGKELPGKRTGIGWATVVSIEPMQEQTMIDLQTSTGTYIAEGFVSHNTTLIAIYFLDCALFRSNIRAGIVAHNDEAVEKIFRDKIIFAYNNLPDDVRASMPIMSKTTREVVFNNNSSIRVGMSMRSGNLQYLHVSEMGKIAAKDRARSTEVMTGSIPAAKNGIVFIESTAEGREGHFYELTERARKLYDQGARLSRKDFAFHFFPWFEDPSYRLDPTGVIISKEQHMYFDEVEQQMGVKLDKEQRAWWVKTHEVDMSGDDQLMWREFPSTPDEPFKVSLEGTFYREQMTRVRKEGRIGQVPYHPGLPVNTFWDIGNGDGTAIWLHQRVGQKNNFIGFIEGWEEPYSYFVGELNKTGYTWGTHYLPHDGAHVRQGKDSNSSPIQMLRQLGLKNIEIVKRVEELQHGIQKTRDFLATCWFDEVACKDGILHLDQYRKKWNNTTQTWSSVPNKDDGHSEAADAIRQAAQGYHEPAKRAPRRRAGSALAT